MIAKNFTFLFLFSLQLAFAQDTLYLKKGNIEIVNINEINAKEIKYHIFDNLSGSLHVINTNDVNKIIYKTGLVQFFAPQKNSDDDKNRWIDDTYREVPIQKLPKDIWASKFGYYFSTGIGAGGCGKKSGFAQLASFSFAYKSHMVSVSGGHFNSNFIGGGELPPGYSSCEASYYGVSLGESLRFKWLLLSASAGIGSTSTNIYTQTGYNSTITDFNAYRVLSVPIEFKLFLLHLATELELGFILWKMCSHFHNTQQEALILLHILEFVLLPVFGIRQNNARKLKTL